MSINSDMINGMMINGSTSVVAIELSQITISYNDVYSGYLLPTLEKIAIHYGGNGFSDGDIFDITTDNGKIITKNCFNGAIIAMEYLDFGYNYYDTFQQILYPNDSNTYAKASVSVSGGKIINIEVIYGGSGYSGIIPVQIIGGGGYGASATCVVSGGVITSITIVHQGNYYTHAPSIIFDSDVAVIEHQVGTVRRYPGYYTDSDSLVSDESFIQDGEYYQTYSYQIEVDELFSRYSGIVKNILHPAGYNMFGALSKYDAKTISAVAKILALQTDQFPIDEIFVADGIGISTEKNIIDNITLLETISKNINILKTDSISITDVATILRLLFLTDSTYNLTDSFSISNFSKSLSDSTGVIMDSIYIPGFLGLVFNDSVYVHSYNAALMYATNFNTDYFASDYTETKENFSKSL